MKKFKQCELRPREVLVFQPPNQRLEYEEVPLQLMPPKPLPRQHLQALQQRGGTHQMQLRVSIVEIVAEQSLSKLSLVPHVISAIVE